MNGEGDRPGIMASRISIILLGFRSTCSTDSRRRPQICVPHTFVATRILGNDSLNLAHCSRSSSALCLGARNAWDGIPIFPWLTLLRARYSARTPSAKSSLVYREPRSICSSANRAATTRCSSDICTSAACRPDAVPESASIPSTLSLAITEGLSESELWELGS